MPDGTDRPLELIYKGTCPYCRLAADTVSVVDVLGRVKTTRLESARGEALIIDHHGELVESPHLFTDEMAYFGVRPTATGLVKEYAKTLLPGR